MGVGLQINKMLTRMSSRGSEKALVVEAVDARGVVAGQDGN